MFIILCGIFFFPRVSVPCMMTLMALILISRRNNVLSVALRLQFNNNISWNSSPEIELLSLCILNNAVPSAPIIPRDRDLTQTVVLLILSSYLFTFILLISSEVIIAIMIKSQVVLYIFTKSSFELQVFFFSKKQFRLQDTVYKKKKMELGGRTKRRSYITHIFSVLWHISGIQGAACCQGKQKYFL